MLNQLTPSARLALLYFLIGSLWIIGSDRLVEAMVKNSDTIAQIQSVKGMAFVCFCSLLIYYVSGRFYRSINRSAQENATLLHKYEALSKASKEGIIDYDIENNYATINEELKNNLGLTTTTIPSFSEVHNSWIHPNDRVWVSKSFQSTVDLGAALWQAEYRCRWHDGSYRPIVNRGYFIHDPKTGRPINFICAIQDVSELRKLQAEYYEQRLQTKLQVGRSIIKAQEEERTRWAGELHDNVCQMLTVVKLYLTELVAGRPLPPAVAKQPQALVEKALNEIRQLSASIRPPEFGAITLDEAVRQLVSSIQRVKSYVFHLQFENLDEEVLNVQHKLMIYRVIQEQISNIVRYADAASVHISVESEGELVRLQVTDDGKGFNPASASGGIGLRNIQSRLQVYSGFMKIDSAPGKGCTLYAQFNSNT